MSKWPPAYADTSCSADRPAFSGNEAVPAPVSPGYGLSSQPFPRLQHDGPSSESCYASHVWSSSLGEEKTRLVQRVPTEIQLTVNMDGSSIADEAVPALNLSHHHGVWLPGLCWSCCDKSQALAHYKGTKHAKKLKSLDATKCKLKGSVVTKETTNQEVPKSINPPAMCYGTDRKDGFPGASPLPLSPVLTLAPTLGSLASTLAPMTSMLPPVAPTLASSPNSSTGTETTSATGWDDRASPKPSSPLEPDMEVKQEAETDAETEEEKARRLLYCSLCKMAVNSASQLEAHNSGTKHKTMLEARSGVGSIKSFPRPGVKSNLAPPTKAVTGLQNKTFHCEICDVHVNSETQLKQHISSRRHKDRAAGKPAKPKYSPYSKPPKGPATQPVKLTVGKELCQPQITQIMPAHLAALAAAFPGLRSTHAPSHGPTLFQTQTLPAALLRPAPGPVRTSHTQLLFAPY
ncbi:zinc finger protein 385D-like isoform X1 [Salvelinus fontinalis]|uniref:zinc finger protein 385D-like isoform X1 n=1 Tax=Salvelinus fontinalis TaxID=8038 RepID=UPI00248593DF|nr:zinc finger protein 385D-like isoform X1 [Salvelinus fontinalis]